MIIAIIIITSIIINVIIIIFNIIILGWFLSFAPRTFYCV